MSFFGSLVASDGQAQAGRARRRAFQIHMYCGRNGSGKSAAAVYDTIPDLEEGRMVLSTVRLLDYNNPRPCDDDHCTDIMHGAPGHRAAHPNYVPFTTWTQLLDWQRGSVLMDEITGVADSNEASGLPSAAANKLAQLRRDECTVRITGLTFIRANKRIREAVTAVTRCRSYLPVDTIAEDGTRKIWRQRRLATYVTYDAQSLPLDDHTDNAYSKADVLSTSRLWIPTSQAIQAYDSLDRVLTVGTVTEAGRCAHCGGNRRNPECSCDDYQDQKRTGRRAAPPERRGAPTPEPPEAPCLCPEDHQDTRLLANSALLDAVM